MRKSQATNLSPNGTQRLLGHCETTLTQGQETSHGYQEAIAVLRRNLQHIEQLLDTLPVREIPLPYALLRKYWIIQLVYVQQKEMYHLKSKRCDNRIVSIHQPHVRPTKRGKANKAAEFGAKLSVSRITS